MRRGIAIVLLLVAIAGLVYGVLGATSKSVKIKSGSAEGVFNLADNSYEGTVGFSTAGGFAMGMDDLRKLAEAQRTRQMGIGFGAFAVLGFVGVRLFKKNR